MSEHDTPPEEQETTTDSAPESGSLRRIGNYHILQKVGEGGMGEVYEAEQERPVRRRVALKVIKHGMDTKQVIARFEAERQALAMMDHPAVAKVFEAGATAGGRPYFVMEFVRGVPLTEHCDRQRLSVQERLELFLQVCEGVQHAHQNAIIHRDLKPSNVLVSIQDGRAVPKIIDFGVAKATTQKLTERTMFTELGVLIGTPEYMSPEQAEGTGQGVDTRTDVYALGVMLYELLVGALPFDPKELRLGGYEGIRKKIREDEPPRPSTRLSSLGDQSTESAKSRRVDRSSLERQLRGDLDWITMRALEKDRTRRYGSPQELAADLARHLAHQPVVASPPSISYRAGKFVRRHRLGVSLAAIGALVLVAFAAAMAVQAGRIARERDRANLEAESSTRVTEFLAGMFKVSDPSAARGSSITARELLDRGAIEIEEGLADQPEIQARLMNTLGDVYRSLGLYPEAEPLLRKAVEVARRAHGDDHPETLEFWTNLGILYTQLGRYAEAEPLFVGILEGRERVLGEDHEHTLSSANNLAILYRLQGRYDEAETLFREILETGERVQGADHPDTLGTVNNLAVVYWSQRRYDEAEPLLRRAFETQKRVQGADHPNTLLSMNNLAKLLGELGRDDDAEILLLEALELQERVVGADHPNTTLSRTNLAITYSRQGRHGEAERLHLEILETQRRVLGDDHPTTLGSMYDIACMKALQGRRTEAIDWLRQLVDAGWADADWMAQDPDLESLHGPEFDLLLQRTRENAAAQAGTFP